MSAPLHEGSDFESSPATPEELQALQAAAETLIHAAESNCLAPDFAVTKAKDGSYWFMPRNIASAAAYPVLAVKPGSNVDPSWRFRRDDKRLISGTDWDVNSTESGFGPNGGWTTHATFMAERGLGTRLLATTAIVTGDSFPYFMVEEQRILTALMGNMVGTESPSLADKSRALESRVVGWHRVLSEVVRGFLRGRGATLPH